LRTLRSTGKTAEGFETADEIAEFLASETRPGDLVLVMSNGSFDGLCGKLLGRLQERVAAAVVPVGPPAGKS
jgi:UDP-N-acetylmuramate: L-alanyl-gamma-D-glutamyl-meso-diaminopimelate ligase